MKIYYWIKTRNRKRRSDNAKNFCEEEIKDGIFADDLEKRGDWDQIRNGILAIER